MHRTIFWLTYSIILAVANRAGAQVWSPTGSGPGSWLAVASSADGAKLAAVNGNSIYTSTDSGTDWLLTPAPVKNWNALASSADGSVLLAVAPSGGVYTSTNYGNTWQSNTVPAATGADWDTAAVSADGNTMIVGGQVFCPVCYSANRGANWSSNGIPTGYWTSVVCSADGSKLAAAWSGVIYVSTNSGVVWTNYSIGNGSELACSADGSRLWLWTPNLVVSTNWGVTGTSLTLPTGASLLLGASFNAKRLVGLSSGSLYLSTNYGTSWITNFAPSKVWKCLTLTPDGAKMVAATTISSDVIYAWKPPLLSATNTVGGLIFSWPTNGTPFGLQMNSSLATTNWVAVTNIAIITNSEDQVAIPQTNDGEFFRLITQ